MFELVFLGTSAAVPSAGRGLAGALCRPRSRPVSGRLRGGNAAPADARRARLSRAAAGAADPRAPRSCGGLAGLVATRALWGIGGAIEIIGSGETVEFVRHYLAVTVGCERGDRYRLRAVAPGLVLSWPDWHLDAFAVPHRRTQSLGFRFEEEMRRPLLAERLAEFGVPDGPCRGELAEGRAVTLADGRLIAPGDGSGAPDRRRQACCHRRCRGGGLAAREVRGADAW